MNTALYPLQSDPILKERIWGGEKLKTVLNKNSTSVITGESWELSTVPGDVSVISNGSLKGISLEELINNQPDEILGTKVHERFGKQFPLLFKFIDAREDLSIQVHPNDELAQQRHDSFGKTEMWYVMQADEGARIIVGFKKQSNQEQYLENLKNKNLLSILDQVAAKEGDVFFLETGTVHAIGAGILLAEIQQTSDITYRIYDYDRVDNEGKTRELHIDLALEAINYSVVDTQKKYKTEKNIFNDVVDCPYFTTTILPLQGSLEIEKTSESFTVYMCVEGYFEIEYDHQKYSYEKGATILIPAALNTFRISGNASILEIYIS